MDVLFLMSIFRLYPELKMSLEHNSVCKNFFLSACFCWDYRFSLREMDQIFEFGGLIGCGNSCLDSVIRYSKVLRLHAILHDAAGAVRSHSGKGPGYCYIIGRWPIMFAWSRDWTTLLTLRKTLFTLHFQFCRLLKQYVFGCTRYIANWEKHN